MSAGAEPGAAGTLEAGDPARTTKAAEPAGVLAIDKAAGWTSQDAVAVVRAALGARRVGHGGTLDPLATGLLPVVVGHATRFADRLHDASKAYAALVVFGVETETDDREGPTRREAPVPPLDAPAVDAALAPFRGTIEQVPPSHSAVRVGGRRAYSIARAGRQVDLRPRAVRVDRLAIASWRPPAMRLLIVCGSGTYVRALARDIGRALGSAAHLGALRRLAVGALSVDDATEVGRVRALGRAALVTRLRPAHEGLLAIDRRYETAPPEDVLLGWESA